MSGVNIVCTESFEWHLKLTATFDTFDDPVGDVLPYVELHLVSFLSGSTSKAPTISGAGLVGVCLDAFMLRHRVVTGW